MNAWDRFGVAVLAVVSFVAGGVCCADRETETTVAVCENVFTSRWCGVGLSHTCDDTGGRALYNCVLLHTDGSIAGVCVMTCPK